MSALRKHKSLKKIVEAQSVAKGKATQKEPHKKIKLTLGRALRKPPQNSLKLRQPLKV